MALFLEEVNKKCPPFYKCSVFLFCCFCSSLAATIDNTEIDKKALLDFKARIGDPLGVMDSWNETTQVCNWYGVTCNSQHQRVIMLNLQSSQLVGSISPSIGNMSFLKDLQLQNNSLIGILPPEIGRLRRLRYLDLVNNSIGGVIPSNISHCFGLVSIRLQYNRFGGEIPSELDLLSNLQVLSIGANNLTGTIPSSLGNLTFLSRLFLGRNNLVGNIPDSFGKLRNLDILAAPLNRHLSGVFPSSILNMSSLSRLDLGGNKFYGSLPSDLGIAIPNLQSFNVVYNSFNGSLPSSIANATNLRTLYLNTNKFSGDVPSLEKLKNLTRFSITGNLFGNDRSNDLTFISSLINATKLEALVININNFRGALPETIGNLSSTLKVFVMDGNNISGQIPVGIGNLVGLEDFRARNNKLSGDVPESIGKLQNLKILLLQQNMFSGNIPFSFGNLSMLNLLALSQNNFQGQIPESLGRCQQLVCLDLNKNNLSGMIPRQVFELSSLSILLNLHGNKLSGPLPKEVGNLKNLGVLVVSENLLSGEIPNTLGSCIRLECLYLQGNHFQGSIPSSLSFLRGLRVLDLSYNNFSGEIPEYLASFQLEELSLSYNDFQGKIPTGGIFKNASAFTIDGNSKLCDGIPELKLPTCDVLISKEKHPWRLVVGIAFGFIGIVLIALFVLVLWCKNKKKVSSTPPQNVTINSFLELTYHNLFQATRGFSSENLIGSGGFGTVYRGTLNDGETFVAIKVLNLHQRGGIKSFTSECKALRNIKHRNLVKVITACSGIDNHGNDFKALVYEYMANGSLEDWLHPLVDMDRDATPRLLNFSQRLNIAIDVAFALDYLHYQSGTTIIHCDLKPSNVLLDDEMIAHIGDFGLSKILSENATNNFVGQSNSIGVRGTIGYASPEYGMTNEVSTCGDVYSFGILLLEMLTGKRPTDEMFERDMNLHRYCEEAIPERVIEALTKEEEEILAEEEERGESQSINETTDTKIMDDRLNSLFAIGLACSLDFPKHRPTITDVVTELCAVRSQFTPS